MAGYKLDINIGTHKPGDKIYVNINAINHSTGLAVVDVNKNGNRFSQICEIKAEKHRGKNNGKD